MIFDTTKTPATNLSLRRCRSNINWQGCIGRICFSALPIFQTIQKPFGSFVPYLIRSNIFCLFDIEHMVSASLSLARLQESLLTLPNNILATFPHLLHQVCQLNVTFLNSE